MRWVKAQLTDELHKWLRIKAATDDVTISEAIVTVLQEAHDREKKK